MANIGDNLIDARDFVSCTLSSMDILVSDARLNIELAQKTLKDIRLDARTLHAKGISQAAQSVLDSYDTHASQPKIDGRITTLYKLVTQYSQGLDEIAPIMPVKHPETRNAEANNTQTVEAMREASYAAARETLLPLLKYAGNSAEALKRLAGVSQGKTAKKAEPHISFESLMPDVSDSALRTARTEGKSVSVSYAANGLAVAQSQVEHVRGELEKIVGQLVRTRIASPITRTAKGLSRGGHIDISARETSKGLDISVACDGETVSLLPAGNTKSASVMTVKKEAKKTPQKPSIDFTDEIIDMSMELGA